jgi:predicted phage terminase large subunit-like protein
MQIQLLKKEKLRRASLNDFFFFLRHTLGYPDIERKPHREVCNFITKEPNLHKWFEMTPTERANNYLYIQKLLMLARGHLKSSVATIGFPIWSLAHDPTLRILIDNEVAKNSRIFLSEIKQHIESERVKDMLTLPDGTYPLEPDYDRPGGWTDSSIRLKSNITKEPTIMTAGVDTAVTGMHFDIIIMDDLVSEKNVTTPEQMAKVKEHYELAYSLLDPGGILIVVGTRYHLDDLYSQLLRDDSFQKLVRPAINEQGEVYFPKKFSKARLDLLRKTQSKTYYSQYMLTPIGGDDIVFKREDLEPYTFSKMEDIPKNVNTFITCDLAISQKETADYTVILVSQVDENGHIWIPTMMRGRFTPSETVEHIFRLQKEWKPMYVGVEGVAFQKSMLYFIKDMMQMKGIYFNIRELKADGDKKRRALTLAPYVENHVFHVHESLTTLIDEMVTFPHAKHDDCVDAAAYIPQIMRKPAKSTVKRKYNYTPTTTATGY